MSDSDLRPYCSQPALFGSHLVFCAAGDLWSVEAGERVARRLTSVAGSVSRPRFSPDGSMLAFAMREDGPTGVYLMPATGGEARRLVHHQAPCEPVGFTPDGARVLFVSVLASTSGRTPELFSVTLDGTDVRRLGWGPVSSACVDAAGRVLISRGYQDPATWKHYRGGLAAETWCGTTEPFKLRKLTDGRAGEAQPAFWGDRVVFLSDADGTGNLWSCRLDGSDRRKLTSHVEYFVRWPQVHGSRCVYQHAGDVWMLDLETGSSRTVDVEIAADVPTVRRRYVEASRFLAGASASPDGSRVLVTSRGKVVAMPAWRGPSKAVGDEDGVRFSHAAWMPDGESVALVNDAKGEEEIEIRSLDPKKETRALGRAGEGTTRRVLPSPDGKWIALSEMSSGLALIDATSGERVAVDRTESGAITELSWSPDSRWLAYAKPRRYRAVLWIFDVESQQKHAVTSPEFDDGSPAFDPAGRYLWFLSRRVYNPYADELQHEFGFPATTKPYALVLQADRPSPFAPLPPDELGLDTKTKPEPPSDAAENGDADKSAESEPPPKRETKAPPRVRIDLEGLASRVVEVPVSEGRYSDVVATSDRIFLLRKPLVGVAGSPADDGDDSSRLGKVVAYDIAAREEKPWANDVRSMQLSLDGKNLLVRGEHEVRLLSATKPPATPSSPGGKAGEKTGVIDLSRVRVRVDPRAEWRQIFREAWRQQRGHFWTASMTVEDWAVLYERYEPLARRVRTRDELSDVLWLLHGELGTSHAYVVGGDEPWRPHYRVGLLGADIEWDEAAQRHRIARIHAGDTWLPGGHSPLALPGVNAKVGDYLLAVDGRECGRGAHPWSLLERPGQAVTLTIATHADGSDARDVAVTTLTQEFRCRYREWVRRNQAIVDEATNGRVGYIHLPDMQVAGLVEFHRAWLWQCMRDGLIVDVRDNGGGNVSQILLSKLNRKLMGFVKARWAEPEALPYNTVVGPLVALCNERTGSDGDIFCQSWKQHGLGPLIGKRTWGGVIGIDRSRTLVDGGYTTQPEYAFWFTEAGWDVEGNGVAPDIEVDITPMDHASQRDPQLDRAIAEILDRLDKQGPSRPELPPPPFRAKGLRRG